MLQKSILIFIMFFFIGAATAQASPGPFDPAEVEKDGRVIAERVKTNNRPSQDLSMLGTMSLFSNDNLTDSRQVAIRQKTYGPVDRYALRFLDSIKRGVTFLTIENQEADNDQYLYIPALGRARKVAVGDKQNAFEDTDFSYEDLAGRKVDDYRHKRLTDADFTGRQCFRVESVAKDVSARYPRQISWIDKESYLPVQVRFFGRDGSLQRVIVAGEIQRIEDVHIPFRTVARDLIANHTTVIEIRDARVNTGLDNSTFDKDRMGEAWR